MSLQDVRNNPSKVQLSRLSHVYYSHPNLDQFSQFARDFGFIETSRNDSTIYYRGYGSNPYIYVASHSASPGFHGPAFVALNQSEFDKASSIPGAYKISLQGAPGGGELITIPRPNGTFMHIVYGQEEQSLEEHEQSEPTATHEHQGPYNTAFRKPRQGRFQRYREGPALVHKIGHLGYTCCEFEEEVRFYTSNFNFIHSDILSSPENPNEDIITFLHLDLGQAYSDHHSLFLQRAPPGVTRTYVHHSSYEIADFDTQLLGHQWLANNGWKPVWGVGRHIEGSQIFDYWLDNDGFNMEHYCDGDVVNEDHRVGRKIAGPLSVWGPEIPADFFGNKVQAKL